MRRGREVIIIMALAWLSSSQPALAGLYEKGGANGLGARAMGMAGAYTALAEDETATHWNPAGLARIDTVRFGTSLGSLYDGQMRTLNLSAAMPLPKGAAAGLNWTHDAYLQAADIHADALNIAGSLPLSKDKQLRLGAGLKVLFGGLEKIDQGFSGVGLDFGLHYCYRLSDQEDLRFGVSIQDLDTRITWDDGMVEQVPQSITLGTAWHLDRATVAALDFEMIHSGQDEAQETRVLRIGAERWFRDVVGIRAGYMLDSGYATTFSFGAGIKVAGWEVQYAMLGQIAELGLSHRLTLSYGLPAIQPAKQVAVPSPAATPEAIPVYKMELMALPEVFSPNGGSLTDSVVFQLNVLEGDWSQIASWRLRIENTDGEVVREFAGQQYTEQFEWDGLNREGKVSADGTYQATLVLYNTDDKPLGEASVSVLIRTEMPSIGVRVSPKRLLIIGKKTQRTIRFRMTNVNDLSGVTWTLEVRTPQGEAVKSFSGEGTVPAALRWDGLTDDKRLIQTGTYEVLLTVADSIGQVRTAMQQFVVLQVAPKISLEVNPKLIKLGDKEKGSARFDVTVKPKDGIVSWQLTLTNAQTKKKVRVLTAKGAPPAVVVWDGRNGQGQPVEQGEYFTATITLNYGQQNTVRGPTVALATDIGTEETGRALALHLTMVTFRSGSSTIQLADFKRLKQASEAVKKYAKRYRLQVKGYTDNREAKGNELELSWERARKVKEYLNISCGIPNDHMEIVGYGARLPLAPETTPAGRAKNRRVEVVLIIQK